ncbi:MAG: ribose-phosphate pyrophosphokinase [Gammaproteobacteria bacterium]|nr:ribose-phosphate pyrophosphokinase [Gammaproteobacteria bacterium]
MVTNNIRLFSGNSSLHLAEKVASQLNIPLGKALVDRFSDGETRVEIQDNVRGREVFIIQSTCQPVNESLMELIIMADAFRRASAVSITAIIPYFGYARQDRRVRSMRVPITAKIVADMLQAVGIRRIITVDLHADQIQGFFYVPVDNIYSTNDMMDHEDIIKKYPKLVIVSPDVGGVVRARAIAKRLNDSDLAIIDKRRSAPNQSQVMNVIGDVKEKNCVIVDDMVDTAGTLCEAANALKQAGAATVSAYCVHPVLSGQAIEAITASQIDELVVSDTIPLREEAKQCGRIRQISLAGLIAETIKRINSKQSVSSLFD